MTTRAGWEWTNVIAKRNFQLIKIYILSSLYNGLLLISIEDYQKLAISGGKKKEEEGKKKSDIICFCLNNKNLNMNNFVEQTSLNIFL